LKVTVPPALSKMYHMEVAWIYIACVRACVRARVCMCAHYFFVMHTSSEMSIYLLV